MTDFTALLSDLRRPKILIRAARAGLCDYRRERDLRGILRDARGGVPRDPLRPLILEERRLEESRTGGGTYDIQRHVAVLTALLAEARAAEARAAAPLAA